MGYFRCWSVRNVLDLYADGRLTESAARRVAFHISSCAQCRKASAQFEGIKAFLKQAPRTPAPEGLTASILERLRQSDAAPEPFIDMRAALGALQLNPAQAAAAVFLTLLIGSQAKVEIPSQGLRNPPLGLEIPR